MSNLETVLQTLSMRVENHADTLSTEEAAKTAIVLPLLATLGFDVFNPSEVIPEFTADTVGKKGEKVDYAIKLGGEIAILIECKQPSMKLEKKHLSQLYRYFSVTNARFAILTNCRFFEFYTDLDSPNRLDSRPFFVFDLLEFSASGVSELKKFEKSNYDEGRILATAERLKYVSAIKSFLQEQMERPSDELVKVVSASVHEGRLTSSVKEMLESATKSAFREIVRDAVQLSLSAALKSSSSNDLDEPVEENLPSGEIVTTEEEIQGLMIIRAIVGSVINVSRVGMRDSKSYCAVLVDDNNRKPLARLHFNRAQKYIGLFDGEKEERVPIESLDDVYGLSERLKNVAARYEE